MPLGESAASFGKNLLTKVAAYRPIRHQRYAAVNVLLISWNDDDTNSATDIKQLQTLFKESFNYTVSLYQIPSKDSQTSLNQLIASFLHSFGGPDNLLIIYYGGHGGPTKEQSKSPCTWAATNVGGPSLDWSLIQPSLLNASCDVAMLLDCCYAGQAAKSTSAHTIELLAATNKDQWAISSTSGYQTFSHALTKAMGKMIEKEGVVTLGGLAKYLASTKAGLLRQPLHISLGGDPSGGPIKLSKLRDPRDPHLRLEEASPAVSWQLKLSIFEPLDAETASSLIRWMTKDSPRSIEDIQFADQALTEANDTNQLCNQLVHVHPQANGELLSYLSKKGQTEGLTLLSQLRSAMSNPSSTHLTDVEAMQVIKTVKQRSQKLVAFIEDSLAHLSKSSLQALEAGELSKVVNQDLRNRVNMRLTVIAEDVPDEETVIAFDDIARSGQRFRTGSKNERRVLIEYFYYDESESNSAAFNLRQVRRISALHAEEKSRAFHSMQGAGFLRESLHGKRYGIIYQTPEEAGSHGFSSLSDLFSKIPLVPLEVRMRTAHALCEALLNLHSIGWYHKSIKSQNVLCFGRDCEVGQESSYAEWNLDCPYLIGFDNSRPSDAETYGTVDFMTPNNIYRHPDRWGKTAPFQRHHDIYALGILLVEIGCWRLLKTMGSKKENLDNIQLPESLRTLLLGSILDRTAHLAGTRFASAIRFCLEKRRWSDLEEWQVQKMMRQSVLEPLRACCS